PVPRRGPGDPGLPARVRMPGGHHRLGPEDPVGPEGRGGPEARAAPRRSCTRVLGAASGRHRRREVIPAAIGSAVAGNLTVMASSMIRVWLPEPDAAELMGGLPDGMVADVWTGDEQLRIRPARSRWSCCRSGC